MARLDQVIHRIENAWLEQLFSFIREVFQKHHLSSHDHFHHLRVWCFAKEIIKRVQHINSFNEGFVRDLIFACFFHDTGLTKTLDIRHGLESYYLLSENLHIFPGMDISTALKNAIIHHDDKTYQEAANTKTSEEGFSVLEILTTADDLDAFGYVGAYRYVEIYMLRNIPVSDLKRKIITNLDNRFYHFKNEFGLFPSLLEEHKKRYQLTKSFFEKVSGHFLDRLAFYILNERYDIQTFMSMDCKDDKEMCTFVHQLSLEWETFRNEP